MFGSASGVATAFADDARDCAALPAIDVAVDARNATLNTSATAQATNPFAVSRKNTSSVWMSVHFVRRRPVRYPPNADAMMAMRISQTMARSPAVDAVRPTLDHGETADKPNPAPSASRIKYSAAVMNAPPITAPHETPDECASRFVSAASVLAGT